MVLNIDVYRINGCEYTGLAFDHDEQIMYFLDEELNSIASLKYEKL